MNIYQITLPADGQHVLINKHPQEVGRRRLCTDGPQYILLRDTLAMLQAGYEKRHARGAHSSTLGGGTLVVVLIWTHRFNPRPFHCHTATLSKSFSHVPPFTKQCKLVPAKAVML